MTADKQPKTRRCPTHPGEILKHDVLPALNISIAAAAREMGISRQMLHKIVSGQVPISPEMALRIGKWCGNGPGLWLRMQQAYDLWQAEQTLAGELENIPSHAVAA